MVSVSTFKSAFPTQFHVSFLSVISDIFLTNCPYIFLFFYSSFFPLIQSCLNSFLFTVLSCSYCHIVSAAFTPSVNGSFEFLSYHPKLFSSILIHPSQLTYPLPPISLLIYALSTLLLGCSARCIVISFLILLSTLFNSSVFHFRISAPYLITETAQVLTTMVLFLPFNFDLNISLNRCRYYLLNFFFNSFYLILSVSNIPKYYNQSHQCLSYLVHLAA